MDSSSSDDDSSSSGESDFEVEEILQKKIVQLAGTDELMPHYLIKWKNYPESDNTWEPLNNLDGCSEKLCAFESRNYIRFLNDPKSRDNIYVNVFEKSEDVNKPKVPEKVIGSHKISGTDKLFHLIKWRHRASPSLVPHEEAKLKYPTFINDYFEKHIDRISLFHASQLNLINVVEHKKLESKPQGIDEEDSETEEGTEKEVEGTESTGKYENDYSDSDLAPDSDTQKIRKYSYNDTDVQTRIRKHKYEGKRKVSQTREMSCQTEEEDYGHCSKHRKRQVAATK